MRVIVPGVLGAALLLPSVDLHAQSTETPISLSLPAQPLRDALNGLAGQTGLQIIYTAEDVAADLTAPRLEGPFTPEAALQRLLKNSGLTFEFLNTRTVAIGGDRQSAAPANERSSSRVGPLAPGPAIVLARAQMEAPPAGPSMGEGAVPASEGEVIQLEEVLVTGSHIRGVQNLSSPVLSYDRHDIEASGYASTQQFMQSLPQNVSNISDTTLGVVNGGGANGVTFGGSGLNLRGLGSESTLVLLNGRRMAPAGQGHFVDVSLIPLSAIDRIEILADGASATYGSDAVGGVVNIITRDDFEGAETRARYGTVAEGSHRQRQIGQTVGASWAAGHALLGYEYVDRSTLDGADRDFFRPTPSMSNAELIPEQQRHGAFATGSHELGDRVKLSADAFYGQRDSQYSYDQGLPALSRSSVKQYGGRRRSQRRSQMDGRRDSRASTTRTAPTGRQIWLRSTAELRRWATS